IAGGGALVERGEGLFAGGELVDDLDLRIGLEQGAQPGADHGMVIDHHQPDAHGRVSFARRGRVRPTVVPSPGDESIATVPPARSRRALSRRSPSPPPAPSRVGAGTAPASTALGSKPRPSS